MGMAGIVFDVPTCMELRQRRGRRRVRKGTRTKIGGAPLPLWFTPTDEVLVDVNGDLRYWEDVEGWGPVPMIVPLRGAPPPPGLRRLASPCESLRCNENLGV